MGACCRLFVALCVALVGAFGSSPAWATFTGAYAQANWTPVTQSFGCGVSSVITLGMPASVRLETFTSCANIIAGYTLTGNIPASGTLSFDWSYTSNFNVGRSASYTLNGVSTTLATGFGPANGSVSIPVVAGQSFSFTLLGGTDASLTISNFSGPQPAPANPLAVPTLSEWSRIALVLLLGVCAIWLTRGRRLG